MDIESLEAANQSLQADLKLAFKRIGDLQAAIEDEMESDDNDDLINRYVCSSLGPSTSMSFDVLFVSALKWDHTLFTWHHI